MHKYDLADVWAAMATIADDAGSPLITARRAAVLYARMPLGYESACRTDLGYLHALGRLANAVMPMTAARFGVRANWIAGPGQTCLPRDLLDTNGSTLRWGAVPIARGLASSGR
jgi:hypothetical protein